ncbi:hypothetical protein J5226_19865 [Lysobacter sp. K5869]|uniref:hypothetical protein n=1 Tax=Lysobacter sp. K5869 TaxID=2820808 RepID=UPI001C060405|nr:hypothetical protein [Lysobacter sp. K5869]QWP75841.1 hypothetical protein J5226_19865 [Lysobacter sp. K5869]
MSTVLRPRALRAALAALALSASLTGCLSAKFYVDPALPKVVQADVKAPAAPKPVQLLSEFRTKGSANARATAELRPRAQAVASASGLFAQVSETAVPGGAQLRVVIDNVPITDNAAAKGFGTGLTLGLAGSMVTDGYSATISYTAAGKTTETQVKHALHTTIGNKAGPAGLTPVSGPDAVHQVMDQIVWSGLKQLSEQHAFDAE